ncbi:MAG: hypothetical protein ACYTEO_19370 [Planctomycetota bacterium]
MKRICFLVTTALFCLPLWAQQNEVMIAEIKHATTEHQFLNKERKQFLFDYWQLDDSMKSELTQFPQRPTLNEECDTVPLTPWLKYEAPGKSVLKTQLFRDTLYVHEVP